jgi:hypothetical protein
MSGFRIRRQIVTHERTWFQFLKVEVGDLKISETSGGCTIEGVLVASQFEDP